MARIGTSPQTISPAFVSGAGLDLYDGSETRTLNHYWDPNPGVEPKRILLLSFINRNCSSFNCGVTSPTYPAYWTPWLQTTLPGIKQEIDDFLALPGAPSIGFDVVVVVSDFGTNASLETAIDALYDPAPFPILRDNAVAAPFANEFTNDPPVFSGGTAPNQIWSFLISERFVITDKWHVGTTAAGHPVSFTNLDPAVTGFASFDSALNGGGGAGFANTAAHVVERIKNLLRTPSVLSVTPADDSTVALTAGAPSFPVKIAFSKPVGTIAADGADVQYAPVTNAANYPLAGGATTNAAAAAEVSGTPSYGYTAADPGIIRNEVTLTVSNPTTVGVLYDGTLALEFNNNATANQRIHDLSATPVQVPIQTVTYNGPEVVGAAPDPDVQVVAATFTDPLHITITFTDAMCKGGAAGTPLDDDNFTLSGTGIFAGINNVTNLDAVNHVADSNSCTLDVSLTGLVGSGTVEIQLSGITDIYGNALVADPIEYSIDNEGPSLDTASLAADNSSVLLTFTEPVFTSAGGTGDLVAADFSVVLSSNGGGATLTSYTVSAGANGSQKVIALNLNGTPVGVETLTVSPLANQIYDAAGNPLVSLPTFQFVLNDLRSPADMALVLDYSGSMDSERTFDGTTQSKRQWVIDAAIAMMNHIDASDYVDATDHAGMVLYSSSAIDAKALQQFKTDTERAAYLEGLEDEPTQDLTAMGTGLARALHMLSYTMANLAYGRKRSVILLADGQQNRGPDVVPSSIGISIDSPGSTANGWPDNGGTAIGNITMSRGDSSYFPIHTVGIGGNSSWLSDLVDIAAATNGEHGSDDDVWPCATWKFTDLISRLYIGSSPQVVRNSVETLSVGGSSRCSFQLNGSVSQLSICISWPGSSPLRFTLKKDGRTVVFDKTIENDDARFFIGFVQFPHCQPIPSRARSLRYAKVHAAKLQIADYATYVRSAMELFIADKWVPVAEVGDNDKECFAPDGSWEIEVRELHAGQSTRSNLQYHVGVIADEKEYVLHVVEPRLFRWTGELIQLAHWVSPKEKGQVLASEAELTVTMPRRSASRKLQRLLTRNRATAPTAGDTQDEPLYRKTALLNLSSRLAKTLSRNIVVRTTVSPQPHSRKGTGLAPLVRARVPGIYRVDCHVSTTLPDKTVYERTQSRTFHINALPDRRKTRVRAQLDRKFGNLTIDIIPKDRYRNPLGPGFSDRIQVTLIRGKKRTRIPVAEDRLDCSYRLGIPNIGKHEMRQVLLEIKAMGQLVFAGCPAELWPIGLLSRILRFLFGVFMRLNYKRPPALVAVAPTPSRGDLKMK